MKILPPLDIPYTNNASLKLRYMAIRKFNEGNSRVKISKTLNVSRRLVNEWVAMYLEGGFDALALKKATGAPSKLTTCQKQQLKEYVIDNAIKKKGGRLMGPDIQKYIQNTFNVKYQIRNIYRLMKELNLSWITSRSMHPKQSQEVQEEFKKFP